MLSIKFSSLLNTHGDQISVVPIFFFKIIQKNTLKIWVRLVILVLYSTTFFGSLNVYSNLAIYRKIWGTCFFLLPDWLNKAFFFCISRIFPQNWIFSFFLNQHFLWWPVEIQTQLSIILEIINHTSIRCLDCNYVLFSVDIAI